MRERPAKEHMIWAVPSMSIENGIVSPNSPGIPGIPEFAIMGCLFRAAVKIALDSTLPDEEKKVKLSVSLDQADRAILQFPEELQEEVARLWEAHRAE